MPPMSRHRSAFSVRARVVAPFHCCVFAKCALKICDYWHWLPSAAHRGEGARGCTGERSAPRCRLLTFHGVPASILHRIQRLSPILIRIIHNDVDHDGNKGAQDLGSVLHLGSVCFAAPRGRAMNKLIAKHI